VGLQQHEHRLRPWFNLLGPLVVCLSGVAALFFEANRRAQVEADLRLVEHAQLVASALDQGMDRVAAYTESIARAFGAIPAIDREAFRVLVEPWLLVNPGLTAFEWLPLVPGDRREAFEAAARDRKVPDFRLLELGPGSQLVPAAPSDFHAPILYVEPFSEERRAVGYDLASEPLRRRALLEAQASGRAAVTGPVRLVMFPEEWGIVVVAAAYAGMTTPASEEERRAETLGFAGAVVRVDRLVAEALRRAHDPALAMRVTDLDAEPPTLMTAHDPTIDPDRVEWSTTMEVAGRTWRADFVSKSTPPPSWAGWGVLAVGLAATGLLVAFLLDGRAESVRIERLVAERTAALGRSNDALVRSNLELQRFAYVASHDLREPLRTVTAFAELLERDAAPVLDAESRDRLARMARAGRRMQDLVSDLLAVARSGSRSEPFADLDLGDLARAALDDLAGAVKEAGATVTVGELPRARCDRVQMIQLFHNLLSNGLKFRRPGVPVEIRVDGRRTDAGCEIVVRDNGMGIDRRDQKRVFEMFQKLDATTPGLGVGLATCRRIVERHGGRMWIQSKLGAWTAVHFTLADPVHA
jgi:signal transduction histidine kinase